MTTNLYAYSGNDPVNLTDSSGLLADDNVERRLKGMKPDPRLPFNRYQGMGGSNKADKQSYLQPVIPYTEESNPATVNIDAIGKVVLGFGGVEKSMGGVYSNFGETEFYLLGPGVKGALNLNESAIGIYAVEGKVKTNIGVFSNQYKVTIDVSAVSFGGSYGFTRKFPFVKRFGIQSWAGFDLQFERQ